MKDINNSGDRLSPGRWSSAQTYVMAVVCLLLGLAVGFLLHGPAAAKVVPRTAASQVSNGQATVQVTPDQLKQMADKQAEPLLAKLQQNSNDAAILAELGKIYLHTQQFQIAAEYYERSAKASPDPETLTTLATVYHFAQADDKAIETLNRALQIDSKYANALFNLGMLKWQAQSDPKAAIAAWEKLLKTNPNHPKRAQVEEMIARAKQHVEMSATANAEESAR